MHQIPKRKRFPYHLCPIHWNQVLSREWRCSWSSTERRCSNYIRVINKFVAYKGAAYIRGLTVIWLIGGRGWGGGGVGWSNAGAVNTFSAFVNPLHFSIIIKILFTFQISHPYLTDVSTNITKAGIYLMEILSNEATGPLPLEPWHQHAPHSSTGIHGTTTSWTPHGISRFGSQVWEQ